MNVKKETEQETHPMSDIIFGIFLIPFGLDIIKDFMVPFSPFVFVGIISVVGGVMVIKNGIKNLNRKSGLPVNEDEEPCEEESLPDETELRCPNCEALLQEGDQECPYCGSRLEKKKKVLMNVKKETEQETHPISDIIYGIISILFGLAIIKVFLVPFSLFVFAGVFLVLGGVVGIKEGIKILRRRSALPVDENEEPCEEETLPDETELRCQNCEALLQEGDQECPYCDSRL